MKEITDAQGMPIRRGLEELRSKRTNGVSADTLRGRIEELRKSINSIGDPVLRAEFLKQLGEMDSPKLRATG